jgi:hypothetical protein
MPAGRGCRTLLRSLDASGRRPSVSRVAQGLINSIILVKDYIQHVDTARKTHTVCYTV